MAGDITTSLPPASPALVSPSEWFTITPHDTNALAVTPRAIESSTDATIAMISVGGVTVTVKLLAGVPKLCRPNIVKATGSSGYTNLIGYV